jgi:regulatory protein
MREQTDSPEPVDDADSREACYLAAMRILQFRFNSEGELRRKLKGKRKFVPDTIDAVVVRLHQERWLDDERYAGAFVRTRTNRRIGPQRIARELQIAGIPEREAARAVETHVDIEQESANLAALCRKRIDALTRRHGTDFLATREGQSKVASWLVSRGYPADDAWRVTKELTK